MYGVIVQMVSQCIKGIIHPKNEHSFIIYRFQTSMPFFCAAQNTLNGVNLTLESFDFHKSFGSKK